MRKMISWNVNGLRACVGKGFLEYVKESDADIFCIQESKIQEGQIELDLPGYRQYWNYAEKKGYSGTAMFTKEEPVSVSYGLGIPEHDKEGRVITAEFDDYYVVTCYTPNSQDGLKRLDYRMEWEDAFLSYLKKLPIDTLKIDKSFIDTITMDENTRVIADSVVNMAKRLGYETIAEGVEDQDQFNYLKKIGCDCIQGFFLGRPSTSEEIERLLLRIEESER